MIGINHIYSQIEFSTLRLFSIGYSIRMLEGEIHFPGDIKLSIYEIIDFDNGAIETYSYEVYKDNKKIYWYDCQPHPNEPVLAITHPHHKHIPPGIKHHRIATEELHFEKSNLDFLIKEILETLLKI
jgi:hypothetical protein